MRLGPCLLCCFVSLVAPVRAALVVTNLKANEALRYPVALLVGTADSGDRVTVANADNDRPDGRNEGPVIDHRFRLLVELRPGANRLALVAGDDKLSLALTYRPMTTPNRVVLVYLTGQEKQTVYPTPLAADKQDYAAKLRTAALLMQTFTAEDMAAQGLGRLTFALELDEQGQPIVHTVAYPEPAAQMRGRDPGEQWQKTYGLLGRQFDFSRTKVLCLNGFVAYDAATKRALGHTALGGGALAVFSTNSTYAWPDSLRDVQRAFDDSAAVDTAKVADDTAFRGTNWAMAATGLGAWLHELGHTFGLPHSSDGRSIMARGFDWFNRMFVVREAPTPRRAEPLLYKPEQTATWDPLFGRRLAWHPWFQPDGPKPSGQPEPKLAFDWTARRFTVTAPAGLVAVQVEGPKLRRNLLADPTAAQTTLTLVGADLRRDFEAPDGVAVTIVDRDGRVASFDERTARNPQWFVRTWRLAEKTQPWTDRPAAPTLDKDALPSLTSDLLKRTAEAIALADPDQPLSVDLLARYADHDNRLAYALAVVKGEETRQVKLLAGGDDGFRIWVNGTLAVDQTGIKVVQPDSATAEVTLQPGDNTILVESQQAGGGWNFALRLTTPDGKPLVLTPDGTLRSRAAGP